MTGTHKRNITGLQEARRCCAKTRKGTPCMSPAVRHKERCRMHGGAKGSGAPLGNNNARKHGMFSQTRQSLEQHIRQLLKEAKENL